MVNQMAEQMDITKKEAGGLMKEAEMMNDMDRPGMGDYGVRMKGGGLNKGQRALRKTNPEVVARMEGVSVDEVMDMADGGMARIKGAPPIQVKGLTYNDNGGKGTF
jgi:hypothetical protein|tara:strand:+ start:294 stop:611 length:318 start_codon:yes stop_codon:yes gene_type:complete